MKRLLRIVFEPKVFFLFVAFILIQLWFSKGMLFGGVEVGVPTYTPGKTLGQIIWLWWEALGPGVSFPTIPPAIPLYAYMAFLERIGLGAIGIQEILFFIIIYVQGLGVSLLFKKIFPQSGKLGILAGLFYIFNPFMMTYVWHRFIYGNIILSAVLPLLIYFYLQLLEKRKFKFIFFFLLTSLLANYMYSVVASVLAIWLSILIILLSVIIMNRRNIKIVTWYIFLTIILFVSWFLTNMWWIYPLIGIKIVASVISMSGNVDTLIALSEKSTINYVIRGINPYYLFFEEDWGSIYQNILFQFLSWIPVLFILVGLLLRDSRKKIWSMILLFLVGIFVAKGAAEPLGSVTTWFYSHFFFLGVIRNPFEKLGLLVILPASIIAAVGINNLWSLSKKVYQKVLIIALIIGCGVYVWPMWSDKLFGSDKYPLFFTLPRDYPEVSNFLSEQLKLDNGKILHLPITESDSTTYNWKYPYNGTEITSYLFPGSSISKFLYISFIDQLLQESARIFHTTNYDLQRQIISNFGVKYIVLHKDIDWYFRNTDNPKFIEAKLDNFKNLIVLKDSEHLKIYKYAGQVRDEVNIPPKITTYSVAGSSISSNIGFMWDGSDGGEKAYLEVTEDNIAPDSVKQKILLPKRLIIDRAEFRNDQEFIPPTYYEKYLPNSRLYPVISIIEKIQTFLTPSYNKSVRMLLLTTKRLRESQRLREQNKEDFFNKSINTYSNYLSEALSMLYALDDEKINDRRLYLSKYILKQEEKDLENLLPYTKDESTEALIKTDLRKIDEFNKYEGFILIYPTDNVQMFSSKDSYSYQFSPEDRFKGNMVIIASNSDYLGALDKGKISLYIDGKEKQVSVKKLNDLNWFDLGEITLEQGEHEITIPISNDNNIIVKDSQTKNKEGLVEVDNENNFRISSLTKDSWVDYQLSDYNPEDKYLVRFYFKVIKGYAPVVSILQERDDFNSLYNDKKIITKDVAQLDYYDFGWRYFETSFSNNENVTMKLARSTIQPTVRISVPVWNNCELDNLKNKKVCTNKEFREKYDRLSIVEFRDLKITKLLNAQLFLRSSQNLTPAEEPKLKYRKVSPVEYLVDIDSQEPNFIVVFNESFHQGWKLELNDGKQTKLIDEKKHYMVDGYANGWLINRSGKFSFKIKFTPQEYFYKAILISVVAYIVIILVLLRKMIARK